MNHNIKFRILISASTAILFAFIIVPVDLPAAQVGSDSTVYAASDSIINYPGQKSEMNSYFYRVIWVTFFILGIIILGFYVYRKSMGKFVSTGKNQIKIVSRHTIGPRQMILVVHVEGQKLLLGVTEQEINLLKDFGPVPADEQDMEIQQSLPANFGSILGKLKKNN